MKDIREIVTALLILLFASTGYIPAAPEHCQPPNGYTLTQYGRAGMQFTMQLPDCFGAYAEVFGCPNLLSGEWSMLNSWIPTYGSAELTWNDDVSTNMSSYFYMISDATMDLDGDGYSDLREHYVSRTDPAVFDDADDDGDGIHDFWEIKLFGNIWMQDGNDDSDGDGLRNNQELAWLSDNTIRMYSDPSLYDTDGEGLDDFTELQMQTDPTSADSDSDGYDDAFEVLGAPPTDPNNPDIIPPVFVLAGG
jgi:hypothetical protein